MDIRPAATLVLSRDTADGIEVLLLQRTWNAVFLPGYFVFPGGSVDEHEAHGRDHVAGLKDADISQIMSLDEGGADYMLAAVRECFEEAGILLAETAAGEPVSAEHPVHQYRQMLLGNETSLAELCKQHDLTVPLDQLAYLSHWITPPGPPRRFDVRFFVAAAPQQQIATHDGTETIDHLWIKPAQALAEHRAGQRLLGMPTLRTLRVLSDFDSTEALMRYAHANPPEPFPTDPWPAIKQGEPVMLEPNAPAYDEALKLDPEAEGSTIAEIIPGQPVEIAAGVTRLTAPNPGVMTGPGTNSYILGHDRFTVLDPGPVIDEHIEKILEITGGLIDQVLVTHTHVDHSPAVKVLKDRTGCKVVGWPAPAGIEHDKTFEADHEPVHGDFIATDAGTLKVLHTPGHAANHLCYLLTEQELLFAGDHIMQGSTVIINPPDGDMKAYVESMYDLLAEHIRYIAPAHGFLMGQPAALIDHLITHRLSREHKVYEALKALAPVNLKELTAKAYDHLPRGMLGLATRTALAHLLKLEAEHKAYQKDDLWYCKHQG
ncbi:MAG: MBL fold metallo-hydrolase [Pseudomonadota bacterium]